MANKANKAVATVVKGKSGLVKVGRLAKKAIPQTELERSQSSQFAAMRAQLSDTFQSKRTPEIQREQVETFVTYVTTLATPYIKARFASKIAQTLAAIKAGEIMGSGPVKGGKAKR